MCASVCMCVCLCLWASWPKGALEAAVVDWRAHVWCGWEIKHTLLMNVREEGAPLPFPCLWSRCSRFITHTETHTDTLSLLSKSLTTGILVVGIHILQPIYIMDVFVLIYELVASNEVNLSRGAKTCVFISVTWAEDYSHHSQRHSHYQAPLCFHLCTQSATCFSVFLKLKSGKRKSSIIHWMTH